MSSNKTELNIHIADKKLIEQIKKYCNNKKIAYREFATRVISEWFENRSNSLEAMSKEELLELIKSGEVTKWI